MRQGLKTIANAVCLLLALPAAALAGFGRFYPGFAFFAQFFSFFPGLPGDYLRRSYYVLTLASCSTNCCISFGTMFSHREAVVEDGVYIGGYCVIGKGRIGSNTQIANNVYILSGSHQHERTETGGISSSREQLFTRVDVGEECWIGTSAVVMADVGAGSTIGAGAVVTKAIPPGSIAVGVPARVVQSAGSPRREE